MNFITLSHKNTGIMAGGLDYLKRTQKEQEARDKYIQGLNTPPGPPTQHGIYATPEWTKQPYASIDWEAISQNQEPPAGWPRYPRFNEPGDVPGPPVQFGPPITNNNVKAGYGFIPNGVEEKNLYYYHPDHLGSSSYITDKNGEVIQHTEYIAFGEVLVDEHSTTNKMPYLFNGKELDYETGLYYYGARYYDPKVSIFLNVDPLVEKTGTPYAYTYNNPIRFIDPTGMEAEHCPTCPKPQYENQRVKTGGNIYAATRSTDKNSLEWLKENDIQEVTILSPKAQSNRKEAQRQANIDAARYRFYNAVENCKVCQEIKSVERFMFLYVPMTIATGGLSVKGTLATYAGKASISIGTQLAVSQDINLVKLTGDTLFNPLSGAVFGNSAEYKVSELIKGNINSFEVSSVKDFGIGLGADVLFMGRNGGSPKNNHRQRHYYRENHQAINYKKATLKRLFGITRKGLQIL